MSDREGTNVDKEWRCRTTHQRTLKEEECLFPCSFRCYRKMKKNIQNGIFALGRIDIKCYRKKQCGIFHCFECVLFIRVAYVVIEDGRNFDLHI